MATGFELKEKIRLLERKLTVLHAQVTNCATPKTVRAEDGTYAYDLGPLVQECAKQKALLDEILTVEAALRSTRLRQAEYNRTTGLCEMIASLALLQARIAAFKARGVAARPDPNKGAASNQMLLLALNRPGQLQLGTYDRHGIQPELAYDWSVKIEEWEAQVVSLKNAIGAANTADVDL